MEWIKKGLIYGPDGSLNWAKNSALQPTPILLNQDVIRVFVGLRDENGVSRVGYVDLNAENPSIVIGVSQKPVLDIGQPGTFDENGVVPCAVVKRDGKIFMYYAGYQLGQKVRFYVFSGLAISSDNGDSFNRYSKVPVLERSDEGLFFRAIHSILYDDDRWKIWYGAGSEYLQGKNKTLPVYNIRYLESSDGINFPNIGQIVLDITNDEHRVGRPNVIKGKGIYKMYYCKGTETTPYVLGYAESDDGIKWIRKDTELNLNMSQSGWDSSMIAYPSVLRCKNKTYLFYNGNDYGKVGFGYALFVGENEKMKK
jgi:predicted GH43/DUF377 family glycosyl hydrolase